jgi:hypothetical protein
MKDFEYRIVKAEDGFEASGMLEKLRKDEWELVAVTSQISDLSIFYFKREVHEAVEETKNMFDIGRIKVITERELGYYKYFSFVMIAHLYLKDIGWHRWFLFIIPLFLIWVYVDIKYIMPREYGYIHSKSPFLQKLMKK